MKAFARFRKEDGTYTNKVFKLDARSRLAIHIRDCKNAIRQLQMPYSGFQIFKGDLQTNELKLTVVKQEGMWRIVR